MIVDDFWFILEAVLGLCTRYPGCTVCSCKADDTLVVGMCSYGGSLSVISIFTHVWFIVIKLYCN
jgi:hypothetical protein